MPEPRITTLLFDYGGTLDTRARHWGHVLWEAYRSVAFPITHEQFREAYVYGERTLARKPIIRPGDTFPQLLAKKLRIEIDWLLSQQLCTATAEEQFRTVEWMAEYCADYTRPILRESRDLLSACREAGYKLVLVTNFYGNIHAVLHDYALEYFDEVIESAVVGVRKPDPAIWQLGLQAAGSKPGESLAIGDSFSKDILPARSLGCPTLWFKGEGWTKKEDEEDERLPTYVVTTFKALRNLLLPRPAGQKPQHYA